MRRSIPGLLAAGLALFVLAGSLEGAFSSPPEGIAYSFPEGKTFRYEIVLK